MGGEWCSVDATWCGTGAVRSWEGQGLFCDMVWCSVHVTGCKSQESEIHAIINPLVMHGILQQEQPSSGTMNCSNNKKASRFLRRMMRK